MMEPARRKRFQIHLSTAVVMMVVAATLMWLNTTTRKVDDIFAFNRDYYGWPRGAVLAGHWNSPGTPGYVDTVQVQYLYLPSIAIDLAVAIAILAGTYFTSEWLIRRW